MARTIPPPAYRLLSLAHMTIMVADPLALVEAGRAAGFDAVGLRIVQPSPVDAPLPVLTDPALQRDVRARLSETGVRLLDVEAVWLSGHTDVERLRPVLDLGAELGAAYLLVVGNDPDRGRMAGNLAALCEAAAARGLRVMLEFIPYSHVRSLAEAHGLLAEVAPADAGLLVDALHLSRSGGSPADLAPYDPALFSYAHLCDAPALPPADLRREARTERLYPGEGGLWLADFVAAFPAGTPMAVEAPSARHAHETLQEQARAAASACRGLLASRPVLHG